MKQNVYLLALVLLISFCGEGQKLQIENAYFKTAQKDGVAAAYMVIKNNTNKDIILSGAQSPVAGTVEIHQMIHEGNIMKMSAVKNITLKKGSQKQFKPGGMHFMFIDLKEDLVVGASHEITLYFAGHETIKVKAPVKSL